jgi:hypothetical protein
VRAARASRTKQRPAYAELRGRPGYWRLEAICGQCGHTDVWSAAPEQDERLLHLVADKRPVCTAVFLGKPRNRCGWPFSFCWVFVPESGA